MGSSTTRRHRSSQKEKIVEAPEKSSVEEQIEIRSFLISFVLHTMLLLCLALCGLNTLETQRIKVKLSFSPTEESLTEFDISQSEIVVDSLIEETDNLLENTNSALYAIENQPISIELDDIQNQIQTQDFSDSILDTIAIQDISKKIEYQTEQKVSNIDSENTVAALVRATRQAAIYQRNQFISSIGRESNSGNFSNIEKRLQIAGAKTGDVQISLAWNTIDDIDLHTIFTPGDGVTERINFMNRVGILSHGTLDVDMNADNNLVSQFPVENIFWPKNQTPKGYFSVYVHFYRSWTNNRQVNTKVRVKCGEDIKEYNVSVVLGISPQRVVTFYFPDNLMKTKF
jgi:hypothetical protein